MKIVTMKSDYNETILPYVRFVKDMDAVPPEGFPVLPFMSEENTTELHSTDLKAFLSTLLDLADTGHCLVLTENKNIAALLLSMNSTLKIGKIAVLSCGICDSTAVEEEIDRMERTVYTSDGTAYFPETSLERDFYADASGRVFVLGHPISDSGETLYDFEKKACGTLLPDDLTTEQLIGWMDADPEERSTFANASICMALLHHPVPADKILLFRGKNGAIIPVAILEDDVPVMDFIWQVFTGILPCMEDDPIAAILESSITCNVPAILLEDITIACYQTLYTEEKPCPVKDMTAWAEMTLNRILTLYNN